MKAKAGDRHATIITCVTSLMDLMGLLAPSLHRESTNSLMNSYTGN